MATSIEGVPPDAYKSLVGQWPEEENGEHIQRVTKIRSADDHRYPTAADVGEMPLMLGVAMTVKLAPLLTDPFTVTLTCPLVAPAGSGATI